MGKGGHCMIKTKEEIHDKDYDTDGKMSVYDEDKRKVHDKDYNKA